MQVGDSIDKIIIALNRQALSAESKEPLLKTALDSLSIRQAAADRFILAAAIDYYVAGFSAASSGSLLVCFLFVIAAGNRSNSKDAA